MTLNYLTYLKYIVTIFLFSFCLASFFKNFLVVGLLGVIFFCLMPSVVLSFFCKSFSIKIFTVVILVSQFITLPIFYSFPDQYMYSFHRQFNFTLIEAFEILSKVGIFTFLLTLVFKIAEVLVLKSSYESSEYISEDKEKRYSDSIYIFFILSIISLAIPIKFWMFNNGVGLIGIEPPRLPFRLSGILFYTFNFLVPLGLSYLYIKTNRDKPSIALIYGVFFTFLGVASVSKAVALIGLGAIVAFALRDSRWIILSIGIFFLLLAVGLADAARTFVYLKSASGGIIANNADGLIDTIVSTAELFNLNNLYLVIGEIANRVEGFQGLMLSYNFNPENVTSRWTFFIQSVNNSLAFIDHNLLHLEYLGVTISPDFYLVAASIPSIMLLATYSNWLMMLPFIILGVIVLIFIESQCFILSKKYRVTKTIHYAIIFFLTFVFYIAPGSNLIIFPLVCIFFLNIFPRIKVM